MMSSQRSEKGVAKQEAVVEENRALRSKVTKLEVELVRRRAEDIVGARDCDVPLPRAGSAAARLLAQNRALRARVRNASAVIEETSGEFLAIADVLADEGGESAQLAELIRSKVGAMAARLRPASEGSGEASGAFDLYAPVVGESWGQVKPTAVVRDFISRFCALAPATAPPDEWKVVSVADFVVRRVVQGDVAAAVEAVRLRRPELTEDEFHLGAEAALYALAASLGERWTESVRTAWCLAIEDLSRYLGFGEPGTTLYDVEDPLSVSLD